MSLIYFGAGGLAPILATGVPPLLRLSSLKTWEGVYYPPQILISTSIYPILFIVVAFGFFIANYKGLEFTLGVFERAPIIPKSIFKNILTVINMTSNFSILALTIFDFQHFQVLNTILYSAFLISMVIYFLLLDLSNDKCFYTPSTAFWLIDCSLLFLVIIHLIYSHISFGCTDASIINTSSCFGYLVNLFIFARYSALYLEIRDRIIIFEDSTEPPKEDAE
ncbi:hypothetical protein TVAG_066790 [Trichomonas vaginalis G3]|uniref:Uncharacterized protein n=1 Tax=Trichomonas vaginalis (strain ATCC PRA-98 / G3) TaxID=412133 RepID=A2DS95_TRIV3|nr:hypothetical protein TVAGG3_0078820 [Trichomonas vaginalis G3]EAY16674.1 hypothetical protein TVAG_066790 [Trichomonas vaginalis G3]KAI5543096.1 hypothetical protein TVAGG3_0078820 [Trichomonas vaginalis G3]|eukprot:XP_001328897.1 hypothetical protein [Trichomonas vaginalis G3]